MYNSNATRRPKCGEIWMANLPMKGGSVQGGYRPVFILSNDRSNTYAPIINVIPLTSKMNKRKLPVHVEIWNYQDCGLKAPSTMLIEQIMTISIADLDKCIGAVRDYGVLNSSSNAMRVQFPVITNLIVNYTEIA